MKTEYIFCSVIESPMTATVSVGWRCLSWATASRGVAVARAARNKLRTRRVMERLLLGKVIGAGDGNRGGRGREGDRSAPSGRGSFHVRAQGVTPTLTL